MLGGLQPRASTFGKKRGNATLTFDCVAVQNDMASAPSWSGAIGCC